MLWKLGSNASAAAISTRADRCGPQSSKDGFDGLEKKDQTAVLKKAGRQHGEPWSCFAGKG